MSRRCCYRCPHLCPTFVLLFALHCDSCAAGDSNESRVLLLILMMLSTAADFLNLNSVLAVRLSSFQKQTPSEQHHRGKFALQKFYIEFLSIYMLLKVNRYLPT